MRKNKYRSSAKGLCAMCHQKPRTGNAYCAGCDAIRKAESRGQVPLPETREGKRVRSITEKTFDLLEAAPGTEVEVRGPSDSERIKVKSNDDGTVVFKLNGVQQRRVAEYLKKGAKL